MAIKIQGTTVIDDSRNVTNVANLTATGTITGDGSGLTSVNAATLNSQLPSHYLNYDNLANAPTFSVSGTSLIITT